MQKRTLEHQFGNLENSSTAHVIIIMLYDWFDLTDDSCIGNVIRIFLIDYSKVFDRINPNILIGRLQHVNPHPILISWICAFLADRKKRVPLANIMSWLSVWGNLPQRTKFRVS